MMPKVGSCVSTKPKQQVPHLNFDKGVEPEKTLLEGTTMDEDVHKTPMFTYALHLFSINIPFALQKNTYIH